MSNLLITNKNFATVNFNQAELNKSLLKSLPSSVEVKDYEKEIKSLSADIAKSVTSKCNEESINLISGVELNKIIWDFFHKDEVKEKYKKIIEDTKINSIYFKYQSAKIDYYSQVFWYLYIATDFNYADTRTILSKYSFNQNDTSSAVYNKLLSILVGDNYCNPHYDNISRNILLNKIYCEYAFGEFRLDVFLNEILSIKTDSSTNQNIYNEEATTRIKNNVKGHLESFINGLYSAEVDYVLDIHKEYEAVAVGYKEVKGLDKVIGVIDPSRDLNLDYAGVLNLYDRYLLKSLETDNIIELPQHLFLRVSTAMLVDDIKKEYISNHYLWIKRAYDLVSKLDFMPSTPNLFNGLLKRPQMSSCYISTIKDSIEGLFRSYTQNGFLSKWAGGLANDWGFIRSAGSLIKSTRGASTGIIPFMKITNSISLAVNQGGKRKGNCCIYLPIWHNEITDFINLRDGVGDDRLKTMDLLLAVWIDDYFMEVLNNNLMGGKWYLFCPGEISDLIAAGEVPHKKHLHECYGHEFKKFYTDLVKLADEGKVKHYKVVDIQEVWRSTLTSLFSTGTPWICFKDPCNELSPQKHYGTVKSSNLCTEITLNTNYDEVAVCNLGSLNLPKYINHSKEDVVRTEVNDENINFILNSIQIKKLYKNIKLAVRMLDNIIDYNYYAVEEAQRSNSFHRPIGLGTMGFTDVCMQLKIPVDSPLAAQLSEILYEFIGVFSISASINLAKEKGKYKTFKNSDWDKQIFPVERFKKRLALKLEENEDIKLRYDNLLSKDIIDPLGHTYRVFSDEHIAKIKTRMRKSGIRNSNITAIAPTATICNIANVFCQSIEPIFSNLYTKSNLSGEMSRVNSYLINHLKDRNLWCKEIADELKVNNGSVQSLDVADDIKHLYRTCV